MIDRGDVHMVQADNAGDVRAGKRNGVLRESGCRNAGEQQRRSDEFLHEEAPFLGSCCCGARFKEAWGEE